jgi:hypothetical protein
MQVSMALLLACFPQSPQPSQLALSSAHSISITPRTLGIPREAVSLSLLGSELMGLNLGLGSQIHHILNYASLPAHRALTPGSAVYMGSSPSHLAGPSIKRIL